jgi:hypothetical protein
MRLFPHQIAIGILGDEFEYPEGVEPFPDPRSAFDGKADALRFLRDLTGEDFGEDVYRWRKWFRRCSEENLDACYARSTGGPARHTSPGGG